MRNSFKFFSLKTLDQIKDVFYKNFFPIEESQCVEILDAIKRVCFKDIKSPEDFPNFDRSLFDGYALKAKDTQGASSTSPIYLKYKGYVEINKLPQFEISAGECCWVDTGSMMPEGADAVIMVEDTTKINEFVEIKRMIAEGEGIYKKAEDIRKGGILFKKGHRFSTADISLSCALGIKEVEIYKPLKVGILSIGDELVNYKNSLKIPQIRDSNSVFLYMALREEGFEPKIYEILPDKSEIIKERIEELTREVDALILSGSSSVGYRDFLKDILEDLGEVLVCGINIKPGKPTQIAKINKKPLFALPGHPTSCFVVYHVLIKEFLHYLQGNVFYQPEIKRLTLMQDIYSQEGRVDFVRIKQEGNFAEVILSKSANISSLSKTDGILIIPQERTGYRAGEAIEVLIV